MIYLRHRLSSSSLSAGAGTKILYVRMIPTNLINYCTEQQDVGWGPRDAMFSGCCESRSSTAGCSGGFGEGSTDTFASRVGDLSTVIVEARESFVTEFFTPRRAVGGGGMLAGGGWASFDDC